MDEYDENDAIFRDGMDFKRWRWDMDSPPG